MTDAAGTRSYTYNEFDELVSESLTVDGVTHAKAPDGCKADWTHAQRAPRRGESAMGRARINQTRVQTSTGIWNVVYNAENRPVTFDRANTDGTTTRVTCAYDYMGRRATKKVETISADNSSTTTLHQRYLYRNYLQIACAQVLSWKKPDVDSKELIDADPSKLTSKVLEYILLSRFGIGYSENVCSSLQNATKLNAVCVCKCPDSERKRTYIMQASDNIISIINPELHKDRSEQDIQIANARADLREQIKSTERYFMNTECKICDADIKNDNSVS